MKITVLCGGPSAEHEVSLVSGRAVADGLRAAGHDVFVSDISPGDLSGLDHPADVIFPVLHGRFGESGELQEILEARGLAFVGSGSAASRIGIDKVLTKQAWSRAGLPVARHDVILRDHRAARGIAAPCVVKSIDGGSSIDVAICRDEGAAVRAIEQVLARHEQVMVEQFIDGMELTIGILEDRALPPIRIVCKRDFFDYQAKYDRTAGTEHCFELGLRAALVAELQELAFRANAVIGARDLARVDLMLDRANRPYLLEINTMPGFTPTSLLPEAAAHEGIAFSELVDRLARRALARRRETIDAEPVVSIAGFAIGRRGARRLKSA
jgi:D-alanine--D-alanine ligase